MGAAVGGLVEATARTARGQHPRLADHLPERGVQHVGVGRVHRQVARAGRVVLEQHLGPGLAAVGRLVNPAFGVGPERVALGRHVRDVGLRGVDPYARDLARVREANGRPGLAGVGRFEHAVAVRHVAADGVLAGADVDHVGVGLTHPDRADGPAEVLIGDGQPGIAAVGGLEDAAAGRAHPVFVGAAGGSRDRNAAAAAEDADFAPVERGERERVEGLGGYRLGAGGGDGDERGAQGKDADANAVEHGKPPDRK